MSPHAAPAPRRDIQALRGYAVLIVLLYHARTGLFPHGYLGVDVFFVVSGFLITQLIRREIEAGRFSPLDFYLRRIKRLLPAAYLTVLLTIAAAGFFLTNLELRDFRQQVWGAITFTANFVLWKQSGYFEGAAELKPLLHMWSLAIEEQYYLLLPLLLLGLPRRAWGPVIAVLALASAAWCVFDRADVGSNFYLLPSRAWELLLGSIGALLPAGAARIVAGRALALPALVMLLAAPWLDHGLAHPGPVTALVCLATLVLLLAPQDRLADHVLTRPLVGTGDISYPLYLLHWPLLAFFHNAWMGGERPAAMAWRLGLVALSFPLAIAVHRWVEQPARYAKAWRPRTVFALAIAGGLSLALLAALPGRAPTAERDYAQIRRINYGFDAACEFKTDFQPIAACRNAEAPEILVWGDSYGMHLVPGLLGQRATAPALVQATRSVCGPLLGVAPVREAWGYDRAWARQCIAFNDSVLAWLQRAPSVRTVVLSSPFIQYLQPGSYRLLRRDDRDGDALNHEPTVAHAAAALKQTVDAIRAAGKRVVVVAPPPTSGADLSRCQERKAVGKLVFGAGAQCGIDLAAYQADRGAVLALMAALPALAGVEVIAFDAALCDAATCRTYADGVFIYRDPYHFSHEGSVWIARRIGLLEQIEQRAR